MSPWETLETLFPPGAVLHVPPTEDSAAQRSLVCSQLAKVRLAVTEHLTHVSAPVRPRSTALQAATPAAECPSEGSDNGDAAAEVQGAPVDASSADRERVAPLAAITAGSERAGSAPELATPLTDVLSPTDTVLVSEAQLERFDDDVSSPLAPAE